MEPPLKQQSQGQEPPRRKRKLPSPRELVAHYESQGMDNQQASLKVIEDLQKVLFRMVTTTKNKSGGRRGGGDDISRKLDVLNSRLLSLEMKVDSKPGYPQSLAIGVAAGALLQSATNALPVISGAVSQIWNSVTRATSAASSVD